MFHFNQQWSVKAFLSPLAFTVLLCSFGDIGTAQSLEIVGDTSRTVYGAYDEQELDAKIYVKNSSNTDKDVKVSRNVVNEVKGSSNQFCWPLKCYAKSKDISDNSRTISSGGGIDSTFKGLYYPEGNKGVTTIEYCYFVTSDTSDSTCAVVHYDATESTSIEEESTSKKIDLQVAPNPASEQVVIDLGKKQKGTLRLLSILGENVLEKRIDGNTDELELNVSELQEGLHFLTFESKNGGSITKKVMIRRN